MSVRFTAYLAMLAERDAALVALALLAIAALVAWLVARAVFSPRTRNNIILAAGIVYHLTLLVVILGGNS